MCASWLYANPSQHTYYQTMLFRNALRPFLRQSPISLCCSASAFQSTSTFSSLSASTSSSSCLHIRLQPSSAFLPSFLSNSHLQLGQVRYRGTLVPRKTKYRKAHKGKVPVRTGGSTAGTTLQHGDYGIRVKEGVRFSAKQLTSAREALKRGIKAIKGAQVYLRLFPDIPVCIKVRIHPDLV